jgi:SAM-dependent methyltransferase
VTLLFHSIGTPITGIDPAHQSSGLRGLAAWRRNGPATTIQGTLRSTFFDSRYYAALADELGRPLRFDDLDVRAMDAKSLRFPADQFDFVFATAVFEHLRDVPAVTREIARVLKPGGLVLLSIHLFPSISGGHNLEWSDPSAQLKRECPPWDHLLDDTHPAGVYLNRFRERDYRSVFSEQFEVVATVAKYEGEQYLTPELERRLSGYSREELLTGMKNFVLRKPKA